MSGTWIGCAALGSLADRRLAQINRRPMDCAQKRAAQVMAGNDVEGSDGVG